MLTRAGITPDPWQADLLCSEATKILMLCSRQSGKSLTAAALALREAIRMDDSLILLLSPTLRQSGDLLREKVLRLWRANGCPLAKKNSSARLSLELANGSQIISLPQNEEGIRGFSSVSLIVLDEAARIEDELYYSVRPMLAVSKGQLVALSTPFGQRGWFYEAWHSPDIPGQAPWFRVKVPATQCPRIDAQTLASERRALGKKWYSMEYELVFLGMAGAVFDPEDIEAARRPNLQAVPFD